MSLHRPALGAKPIPFSPKFGRAPLGFLMSQDPKDQRNHRREKVSYRPARQDQMGQRDQVLEKV